MDDGHDIADRIKRLGKGMEILGVIGAVAGLGLAAASGPIVVWAVAAEISIDMALGAAGFVVNKLGDRLADVVSRFEYASRIIRKGKDENIGKTISKLALVTAPLELISGFAIAESAKPMAIAAITVTALPCAATALWGLMRNSMTKRRAKSHEAGLTEDKFRNRLLIRLEDRIKVLDDNTVTLGRLVRDAVHGRSARKIRRS